MSVAWSLRRLNYTTVFDREGKVVSEYKGRPKDASSEKGSVSKRGKTLTDRDR